MNMKTVLLLCTLLGLPARAEEALEQAPLRRPTAEASVFLVPYGVAYLRSAFGASIQYQVPLIQRPGILWETTNVTFGVRDLYGYVNNSLVAYAEVTPIAFFKLHVALAHDFYMVEPLSGGIRILTAAGAQKLASGQVRRGDPDSVDWVQGQDNRQVFEAPVDGGGLRLRVQPTLQGRLGPIAMQYNFAADYNFYSAGSHGPDAIFHDSMNFTLRRLRDTALTHELLVVYEVPQLKEEVRLGLIGKHYSALGTGLDSQTLSALFFFRPARGWPTQWLSPWLVAQAGTNTIDPMHRFDLAWILVTGLDIRLM